MTRYERDRARYEAVLAALDDGYNTSSRFDQASAFEVASKALAGSRAAGAPMTIRNSFYRIRKNGKDTAQAKTYSEDMQREHEARETVILTVRVPRAELEALRRVASADERSMSGVMRLALRRIIDEHRAAPREVRA